MVVRRYGSWKADRPLRSDGTGASLRFVRLVFLAADAQDRASAADAQEEPALPMLMMLPTLPMLEMLSKLLMLGKPVSLPAARLRLERVVLCMRVDLRAPPG